MPSNPSVQLADLVRSFGIDYLLNPLEDSSPLVNLGVKAGIPSAEMMNGASLVADGLFASNAAIVLDGVDDYLDLNWEPSSVSADYTMFGISKLLSEAGREEVVVWFQVVEGSSTTIQMRVVRSASESQGSILPLGVVLRVLNPDEIEALYLVLSELASFRWSSLGVSIDSNLTGVSVNQTSTGVSSP